MHYCEKFVVFLQYGGSTSSSTAGVLACQWNNVPGDNLRSARFAGASPPHSPLGEQNAENCAYQTDEAENVLWM